MPSEKKAGGPPQGSLLPGVGWFARGQGCQKSFLEKEKQDSENLLVAAFILI